MLALVTGERGEGGDDDVAGPEIQEPMEVPITDVDGDPAPIVVARRPYEVTYRVEGFTPGQGAVIDTERRWVRPPFDSRVESRAGDGERGQLTFLQVATFGFLQTGREDEEPAVLATEPVVAPGDARLAADVDSAVAAGVLEWQGQERTVLGRRCQVFRTGTPIDVATPGPPVESPLSYADLCIGDDGVLLHEEWVIDGNVFRRRIATSIEARDDLDDALFRPTGLRPEPPGDGVLREVSNDSQPPGVDFYDLVRPPAGFGHLGRFGYTPPRAPLDLTQGDPAKVAQLLDVYVDDDGGLLVVANGGTSDRSPFIPQPDEEDAVDLGDLGTGEVVVGLRQHEVRVGLAGGRFVRVWGTIAVEDLIEVARSLQASNDPDGEVTPI